MKDGPLISPYNISFDFIPVFHDKPYAENHIIRRKEPKETRMATDKVRTLMWMTQDRENKKKISMINVGNIVDETINLMDKNKNEWTNNFIDSFFESVADFCVPRKCDNEKVDVPVEYIPQIFTSERRYGMPKLSVYIADT